RSPAPRGRDLSAPRQDATRRRGLPWPSARRTMAPMTRPLSARFARFGALALVAALVAILVPRGAAADAWRALKRRIFIRDSEFGSGYGSDAEMISAIKKQSKSAIKGDGTWTFHMTVFLKEAAGADKINIVYYDVSKKREQVNFSEVDVKPDQKMVQLNGI